MKRIINKIRYYFIGKKIEKIMVNYLWSMNTPEAREEIRIRLNKITGADLKDETTPEAIDGGMIFFTGYSPRRNKIIHIAITPIK